MMKNPFKAAARFCLTPIAVAVGFHDVMKELTTSTSRMIDGVSAVNGCGPGIPGARVQETPSRKRKAFDKVMKWASDGPGAPK